jgi:D-glycerate 3-kinase
MMTDTIMQGDEEKKAGRSALSIVEAAIRSCLEVHLGKPIVVGLCGAQGSGKSTLCRALTDKLELGGIAAETLSLDDLYLTRQAREALAGEIHPLLRTRGVPGTHDTKMGLDIFDALDAGDPLHLPRFDKAIDDRAPTEDWRRTERDVQVLLFEGWCVGASPQSSEALATAANRLEREEDKDKVWRTYVNDALGGTGYRKLFERMDLLILLAAPDFSIVADWRIQQEKELRAITGQGMQDEEVRRFVDHYERLSRHILEEMPTRADLVLNLAADRAVMSVRDRRNSKSP